MSDFSHEMGDRMCGCGGSMALHKPGCPYKKRMDKAQEAYEALKDGDERDVITPLPPIPPVIGAEPSELLTGDLARAYTEFQYAARELEGKHSAFQSAQERYRVALAKFTKLATGA